MSGCPITWIALAGALALTTAACARPSPAPGAPAERAAPSQDFARCQALQAEAEALARLVDRDQAPADAAQQADRIAARLVEIEEQVCELSRTERPHARRLVDRTLALLDAIREKLTTGEQP